MGLWCSNKVVIKGSQVSENQFSDQNYRLFSQFLEKSSGIVLGDNKQYLVKSRLSSHVKSQGTQTLDELIEKIVIRQDRRAQLVAIEAMTTNETLWFRDTYPFSLLESTILPQFQHRNSALKIWSAACSSGQEAYSIAMTIANYKKKNPGGLRSGAQILGTDISEEMLNKCRLAEYEPLALSRGLSEAFKYEFFDPIEDAKFRVKTYLKVTATFRQFNLLDSYSSLGQFDIIFCRNVLIYFSPEVKKQILQKIAACLQDGGILFVGASESISDLNQHFTMVRCNPGLYYLKKSK
jgi:chemotaxis protein methyltransferase CheR